MCPAPRGTPTAALRPDARAQQALTAEAGTCCRPGEAAQETSTADADETAFIAVARSWW